MRDNHEIEKQIFLSTLKGGISAIPVIGGALNEFIFEARGRIKQKRVNKFVEALAGYFSELADVPLHLDQIEREDFGDFFEALINKVSLNHSELKATAFKHLLGHQLRQPQDIDYTLLYLDIISGLHEKEIVILEKFNVSMGDCSSHTDWYATLAERKGELKRLQQYKSDMNNNILSEDTLSTGGGTPQLDNAIEQLTAKVQEAEAQIARYTAPYRPTTYGLEADEFYFLIQDLSNKGLLIDYSMRYGYDPHTLVEISTLGINLMDSLQ